MDVFFFLNNQRLKNLRAAMDFQQEEEIGEEEPIDEENFTIEQADWSLLTSLLN